MPEQRSTQICDGLVELLVNSVWWCYIGLRSSNRSLLDDGGGLWMSKHHFTTSFHQVLTGLFIGAFLGLSSTFAQAGPCGADIAQFEAAVRQSATDPNSGLAAPQSVGAQLGHQPTVASMKRAEQRLKSKFLANLARAKRLDAKGDRLGCTRALSAAKRMYIL